MLSIHMNTCTSIYLHLPFLRESNNYNIKIPKLNLRDSDKIRKMV